METLIDGNDFMINGRHTLSTCIQCGDMVICADCGNNCCNGMSGRSRGISLCDCSEAYAHQTNRLNIKFAKDERRFLNHLFERKFYGIDLYESCKDYKKNIWFLGMI